MRFDFPPFPRYAARSVASGLSGFHVRDFLRLFIPPFVASLLRVALYAMWLPGSPDTARLLSESRELTLIFGKSVNTASQGRG